MIIHQTPDRIYIILDIKILEMISSSSRNSKNTA